MNRLSEGFVLGDRYVLGARIASGGMADVWAGADQVLQRSVAIKVMRPDTGHEELRCQSTYTSVDGGLLVELAA